MMVEVGGFLQNPELVTSGGKVCIKCSKSRVFIPDTFFFFLRHRKERPFLYVSCYVIFIRVLRSQEIIVVVSYSYSHSWYHAYAEEGLTNCKGQIVNILESVGHMAS